MLRLRVVTAVVLLGLVVFALALGRVAVAIGATLLFGVALYEWLRLVGHRVPQSVSVAAVFSTALLALELLGAGPGSAQLVLFAGAAIAIWLALVVVLVQAERQAVHVGRAAGTVLGLYLLGASWLALMDLHRQGAVLLVSTMAIVWLADIAAYFGGRAFGRRKLAPRISPGKTWAGVLAAVIVVVFVAELVAMVWPAADLFSSRLVRTLPWFIAPLLLAALVALSIVGDLFESLLKRQAGTKDSGTLLPGHGGVLDRIDALVPTLPAAVLIQQLIL
jgi:phosphatidate cytidylyltransferase